MNNLAAAFIAAKRWTDAEKTARSCLVQREKSQPDDSRRYQSLSQLGAALATLGREADAEPLLVQGYEGLKLREPKIPAPHKKHVAAAAACPVLRGMGQKGQCRGMAEAARGAMSGTYAMISLATVPATSVNRKSRPAYR
jgi:hypothetical protein